MSQAEQGSSGEETSLERLFNLVKDELLSAFNISAVVKYAYSGDIANELKDVPLHFLEIGPITGRRIDRSRALEHVYTVRLITLNIVKEGDIESASANVVQSSKNIMDHFLQNARLSMEFFCTGARMSRDSINAYDAEIAAGSNIIYSLVEVDFSEV